MTKAPEVVAPAPNGQTPTVDGPKELKDHTNDELRALRKALMDDSRRIEANVNLVVGVLIGRGEDVADL